jgi:hypothetical protein
MIKLITTLAIFLPKVIYAQGFEFLDKGDGIAYASFFTGSLSFLLSIIIGVIATYFIFRSATKMGGGLFGSVLNYIGIGTALIVFGAISILFLPVALGGWVFFARTVFFAIGFIFLAIGAEKLLRGITK